MANPTQQSGDTTSTLLECLKLCLQCANECIDQQPGMKDCIKLCYLCADTCIVCLKCTSTGLAQTKGICNTCADVCDACAAECDKGQAGIMRQCADACRQCASACR